MPLSADVQAAQLIRATASLVSLAMHKQHTLLHAALWENPAATPSQVLAQLATDAASQLNLLEALATFLASQAISVPAAPNNWVVTKNTDGTASLAAAVNPPAPAKAARGKAK